MQTSQNPSDDIIKRKEDRESKERKETTLRLEVLDSSSPDTIFNMLISEKKSR